MEKFSAFRDPGTGIQPFLRPVPPTGSETLVATTSPLRYIVGIVRTLGILILSVLYLLLVQGVCLVLKPVPPLYRAVTYILTALISRLVLLFIGLPWISVEVVIRKRGRSARSNDRWNPGPGDIIVSNWASTVEILWLAFRFNPIFLLPIYSSTDGPTSTATTASPISRTPGRRTGTGSAAISSPSARALTPRVPIIGFRAVSLMAMLSETGRMPSAVDPGPNVQSLEDIRSKADRPVVVFPECTTSNGRGLLRFAEVFANVNVPVTKFKMFIMCVRYDPPTALCSTLTHPIPSSGLNPLSHIFSLATSLAPLTVSIRLLSPSESPGSGSFLASEFLTGGENRDVLAEACASLIAQIGKIKRVGLGWEDKVAFLEFYKGKKR